MLEFLPDKTFSGVILITPDYLVIAVILEFSASDVNSFRNSKVGSISRQKLSQPKSIDEDWIRRRKYCDETRYQVVM